MFIISDEFVRKASEFHGEEGVDWVRRLPAILAECEQRWELIFGPPFTYEAYAHHYVAPAVRADGRAVVVKVHAPTDEFTQEAEALRLFDGHGIAQLLDFDADNRVLLMEHLRPGTPLSTLEDDEVATSQIATIMRQLWRPAPPEHPFPSVNGWMEGLVHLRQHYGGGTGPFPTALVEAAETLFAELSSSVPELVLLHGDLHHDNILAAEREPWLAIDPKGVIGEPAYEAGALLHNPHPGLLNRPDPGRVLARRIDQLADELGLDKARIHGWGLAQAVLSNWWTIEDYGEPWPGLLTCAELLATIKV